MRPTVFDDRYRYLLGTHRVQRVSSTEKKGRRHTSFAEAVEVVERSGRIDVRESDINVETYRGSGAGGQHRNKTDSCVRMTHTPTGISAVGTESRSQVQNRKMARQRLLSRLNSGTITVDVPVDQQWNWCEWRDEVVTSSGTKLNMSKTLRRGLTGAR